ncbi:hypothetical protein R6Q59_026775 [Mikania micrantha]
MTQEGVGDVTPKVFIKKKDVVHVDSSPVDKDKHRTPQVNLTVDGGHVELQTTGVLFGNIHEPSFSLGMTQEGIGNVTPNNLVKKAGKKSLSNKLTYSNALQI